MLLSGMKKQGGKLNKKAQNNESEQALTALKEWDRRDS